MSAPAIRFGTDGWRAVMAREFTTQAVKRVALALALRLERRGEAARGVAVGFDRRLLSDRFAAEFAGVLAARGIRVLLPDSYVPTPVLSWAVVREKLANGVMITASHNPPEWNGIKIKEPYGGPSVAGTNRELEEILAGEIPEHADIESLDPVKARRLDLLLPLPPISEYEEKVRRLVDFDASGRAGCAGFDAMHGCGAGWTDVFLSRSGVRVSALRTEYNPGFGGLGPEPLEERLGGLMEAVSAGGLRLGVANDGDADRIAAVDERGKFFSPQRILAVLTKYLWEVKGLRGDIAKTVSATSMLDLLAAKYGNTVFETPIGFRHTSRLMMERKILIGGEESGAVGMGAHIPERDGVANALLLAELVGATGLGLWEYLETIHAEFGTFEYLRRDFRLSADEIDTARGRMAGFEPPTALCGVPVMKTITIDGMKLVRDDHSWLLIRASGTEPLLRVYAEARTTREARELLEEGRRFAGL